MMNNKRFALTVNEAKEVELWKLDTLQLAKSFVNQDFNAVKAELSQHDMKHSPQSPLPQTWMSLDIGLGCLTMHMESTNWHKGLANDEKSDVIRLMGGDGKSAARSVE